MVRGIKQVVSVPTPATGAEWVATVPGGEQWRVLCGFFTFQASAAVANRTLTVVVTVEGRQVWRAIDTVATTAGNFVSCNVVLSDAPTFAGHPSGFAVFPLPHIWLPSGATVGSLATVLDVGDQYQAINLWVERCYLADQKLDEIAEIEQQAYFAAMRKAGLTQGA